MVFRFRRSIKLMPGVRLNVGKRGSSLSLGGKGATVNVSKKGTRTTIGVPGTGLSYSSYASRKNSGKATQGSSVIAWVVILAIGFLIVKVFS